MEEDKERCIRVCACKYVYAYVKRGRKRGRKKVCERDRFKKYARAIYKVK